MANYDAQNYIVTNGLVLNLDAGDPDSFTRSQPLYVEVLVVAGGGGGGMDMGGGGGGGGVLNSKAYTIPQGTSVTVTVGAGGAGAPAGGTNGQPSGHQFTISATNGSDSVFDSLTAIGGGFGASSYYDYTPNYGIPGNGGSGGGPSGYSNGSYRSGGTNVFGQGFPGGRGGTYYYSGGGGGAGGAGTDSPNQPNGGPGAYNDILGTGYYWGGGGGGASYSLSTGGNGGIGGGGGGALGVTTGGAGYNNGQPGGGGGPNQWANTPGGDGGANTGGGGGGGSHYNANNKGGNGGSGIVIVKYPGLPAATGGTITYVNGYTVHIFTSSGTFTPNKWTDLTGNNNSGSLVNGVGFNSYENGGYLTFDGTDDVVDVVGNFGTYSSYTICYWAMRDAENRMPVAGRLNGNFYWYGDNSWRYVHGGVGGEYYYAKNVSIPLGSWGHLCVVYNGSNVSIYRQGIYQGQQSTTGTADWSQGLKIGYWSAGGGYAWLGKIPVVQFYNRALSAAEITQNFNAQKSRFGL
jgi:hypothetical protein